MRASDLTGWSARSLLVKSKETEYLIIILYRREIQSLINLAILQECQTHFGQ